MSRINESDRARFDLICSKIMVTPIDGEKLAAHVGKSLVKHQRPDLAGKVFEMADKYALSADRQWVLDDECCANSGKDGGFQMAIRRCKEEIPSKDGNGKSYKMFPFAVWDFTATEEELNDFLLEPIDLKTFMGQRFCYNPRIKTNMNGMIKLLKK